MYNHLFLQHSWVVLHHSAENTGERRGPSFPPPCEPPNHSQCLATLFKVTLRPCCARSLYYSPHSSPAPPHHIQCYSCPPVNLLEFAGDQRSSQCSGWKCFLLFISSWTNRLICSISCGTSNMMNYLNHPSCCLAPRLCPLPTPPLGWAHGVL